MGIVIPASTPFNMRVFKISVSITRDGKISPHTRPIMGIIRESGFFYIPSSYPQLLKKSQEI